MNKITNIRIKYEDGTYSDDIPIQTLASNILLEEGSQLSLMDILGQVKYTTKGSIQHQLDTFSLDELEEARIGTDDVSYDNLKMRLDNEHENLQNQITTTSSALQNQINTRLNMNNIFRQDIDSEVLTRTEKDHLLSEQIVSLSTNVNNVQNNIDIESTIRATADNYLQTQIDQIVDSEEQETKMDNLTINFLEESSNAFPIPEAGDNGSTIFGKIVKWFSDMYSLVSTKLNKNAVINNLTTTSDGYALDARQGKILSDKIISIGTPMGFLAEQRVISA